MISIKIISLNLKKLGPKRAPVDIFWDKTDKRYFAVVADYMKTS